MTETTIAGLLRQIAKVLEAYRTADRENLGQLINELDGLWADYDSLPLDLRQMAEKYLPQAGS